MKKFSLIMLLSVSAAAAHAQVKLGDNPAVLNAGSVLELESTNKGVLLPRLSTAQQTTVGSPVAGLILYNTDSSCVTQYNGSGWASLCKDGTIRIFSDTTVANAASPTARISGTLIHDLSCGCNKLFYNGSWHGVSDFALSKVYNDTNAANIGVPTVRQDGMIIFDKSAQTLRIFSNNKWITPGASPVNNVFADTTAANAYSPGIRNEGQQIYTTNCNCLSVFHNNRWTLADGNTSSNSAAFSARASTSNSLVALSISLGLSGAAQQVNFSTEDYDMAGAFTNTSGDAKFTAPAAGVYHFDVGLLTSVTANVLGNYTVGVAVNGTIRYSQPIGSVGTGVAGLSLEGQSLISKEFQLSAGDIVRIFINNTGLVNLGITLDPTNTYFDGHLVR